MLYLPISKELIFEVPPRNGVEISHGGLLFCQRTEGYDLSRARFGAVAERFALRGQGYGVCQYQPLPRSVISRDIGARSEVKVNVTEPPSFMLNENYFRTSQRKAVRNDKSCHSLSRTFKCLHNLGTSTYRLRPSSNEDRSGVSRALRSQTGSGPVVLPSRNPLWCGDWCKQARRMGQKHRHTCTVRDVGWSWLSMRSPNSDRAGHCNRSTAGNSVFGLRSGRGTVVD